MRNFTHLNVHSDHSLLKGFGTIKEYVDKAKENGQSAIALTDNNSMTGIYQFIKYCESSGVKPIPGITLNIAPNGVDFKDTFTFDENNMNLIPNRGANTTLTILAKNQNGLRNLFKLIELSYEESNFFIVPRVDLDILKEYKDDLIIMSGSVESELGIRMELKQSQEFLDYIQNMKNIFGDNFFIEVNRRTINDTGMQDYLIKAADMYNVKIIYTNEVYYLNQEDSYMQELEMCLDSKARMSETSTVYGGRRPALGSRDYYLKDNQEIEKDIKSIFNERTEEIYDNIDYIVNQIDNFSLEYNQHLRPKIDIPPQFKSNIDYLKYLINQGFKKKRGNASNELKKESIERVKMELDTIIANDFVDYFLVVADFCNWSQDNGIPLGTGRGSCAGSETAYLLNIHKTDPLRFGLLFERFISPGRGAIFHIDYDDNTSDELVASEIRNINGKNKYIHELKVNDNVDGKTIKNIKIINPGSPPDVDTDFLTEGRGKVIEYVRNKYGMENVALIITYMPFKVKNAFKDMCSINDVNFGLANKLSSAIPAKLEKGQTLEDFYLSNEGQELRNKVENLPSTLTDERVASIIYKNSSEITKEDILNTRMQYIKIDSELSETRDKVEQSIKQAGRLENRVRNTGIHACGIIISSDKLTNTIPLQITEKDGEMQATTQWTYPCCEALGLIKMDFLGLDTVDIIYNTVNFIKETKGIEIDIEKDIINSDLKDPATMKLFQDAETIGIFQFSKPGVRRLLKEVKPTEFDELAAITALYRPGPMGIGLHTDFAKRKNDESARIPVHKDFYGTKVEEILKPNLNALIFQENIMQIARQCAGFSAKEADTLRKAIGKKKIEIMNSMKDRFIEGMMNNKEDHYTQESVEYLWEAFVGFGQYAFNKSHSYSYALNSYQCAYLKAHYPVEFMAATLRQRADSTEKVDEIIQEIKRLNIKLRPPSINESYYRARPTKDGSAILYGISNIKGISRDLVYDIIEERKNNGLYKDFNDFLFRLVNKLTKTSLMVLSQSGCFDCLGIERKAVYENANYIIKQLSQKQKENKQLEKSLFALMTKPQDDIMTMSINIPEGEWSLIDKLNKEKETLSSYISAHPLDTLIEKEHIDPINLNDEESKDCIVLVSDVDIKSPDNCLLLLDNKESQMTLKMTKKDSRRIYKGMLMKQEKRLSNTDSATKMNLSLEEFEKIDPLYIKSGEVGTISIKHNVIPNNNYSYFVVKDFKPILLDKYGQRVHTIIIKPIQLKVIGEIRAEIEKHKGNDTVRLILPDRTYIDIYNVEFRPGTTQYDLDNITE